RSRPERRPNDHPDRLDEGDQSRADETDDGKYSCCRRLYHGSEEGTGDDRTEAARHKPLQCAAERVACESLQAFGEVVDSKQEQTESTQERHGGRGIHRLCLDSSCSSVEQNDFKNLSRRFVTKLSSHFFELGW